MYVDDEQKILDAGFFELDTSTPGMKVRVVRAWEQARDSEALLHSRYSMRGYAVPDCTELLAEGAFTLQLVIPPAVPFATVTLNVSQDRLLCEQTFGDLVGPTRAAGYRLCEVTKLAIQDRSVERAGQVTAAHPKAISALLHSAFLIARKLHRCDLMYIEVNPRHVRYYKHLVGFKECGQPRRCERADAPAHLMVLDMAAAESGRNRSELPASRGRSWWDHTGDDATAQQLLMRLHQALFTEPGRGRVAA